LVSDTLVVDNIGLLVTNDHTVGEGPLGILRNASVIVHGDKVQAIGRRGESADRRIDAAGMCVVPGFVDSHTHLVFAGDRGDEFAARMAGAPYKAGGILSTVQATRAATDNGLRAGMLRRWNEAKRSGTTTIEIKSGYGLNLNDELRTLRIARELSGETTFLGAHLLPPEFEGRAQDYIQFLCDDVLPAVAPFARWVDAFCETGAFNAEECRTVIQAGVRAGLGARLHGNQLGHGPGVALAVELGCASVDHCTYLSNNDVDALASSDTVATLLPATDFCTRQPYPDARRLLDAGATVAIASNCNPGSSYTTNIPFCMALAVREMRMTAEEALAAATLGGANALRRNDVGKLSPGCSADMLLLDAPSYTHLVYRTGVPIVRWTMIAGRREEAAALI
jgi:imidazolonepropionase